MQRKPRNDGLNRNPRKRPIIRMQRFSRNESGNGDARAWNSATRDQDSHLFDRVLRDEQQGIENPVIIRTIQQAKRFLKILVGFTLLALGIVMILTPGPGVLTIALALGVLAAEFVWARRLLDRVKEQGVRIRQTLFQSLDRA
jgi:Flp pilus assembly protein TadB